jgi:hypothetical protein
VLKNREQYLLLLIIAAPNAVKIQIRRRRLVPTLDIIPTLSRKRMSAFKNRKGKKL